MADLTAADLFRASSAIAESAKPLSEDGRIVRDVTVAAADVPAVLAALLMARIAVSNVENAKQRGRYWRSWFRPEA